MSEQRQHFLLSYLKTLSVGPAGVEGMVLQNLENGTRYFDEIRRTSIQLIQVQSRICELTGWPVLTNEKRPRIIMLVKTKFHQASRCHVRVLRGGGGGGEIW